MSKLLLLICILSYIPVLSQCIVEEGPPPSSSTFATGTTDANGIDSRWTVARDSLTADFLPAVRMNSLPSNFYNASSWISFSTSGEHTADRFFFYKTEFELPCFNQCKKSYSEPFAFCLNLDLYSDNSIYEIFINGTPQRSSQPGLIRFDDPFNPGAAHNQSTPTSVTLCRDWKPGKNTLIIQIASSATIAGIYIEAKDKTPYMQVIEKQICKGGNYLGHTRSGTFIEHYVGINGCDSTREIKLEVRDPVLPYFQVAKGICEGDSLTITPGKFDSYLWNDGSHNEYLTVKKPGIYSVSVQSACGSFSSEILVANGNCGFFFPNAFTANSDGKNDFFGLRSDLVLERYSLEIFNRWGLRVFSTKVPSEFWDGNLLGKPQPSGTYVWKCIFTRNKVTNHQSGTVLLIR